MKTKNKKNILNDITFLIPVRIDSIVRMENLLMVTNFLHDHLDTNISILEASNYNNGILSKILPEKISYTHVEDYDPIFHRTKYINMMVQDSHTPYLAVWDADVIIPIKQIVASLELLQKEEADFVSPYRDKFWDTTYILRELYLKTGCIHILEQNKGKMVEMYAPNPEGGVFFVNKETYIKFGMENENFYGWGREDGDRVNRCKILGYSYKRVEGSLFHFTHERGLNSKFHSPEQERVKFSEFLRIISMSKRELEMEVKTWDK